MMWTPELHARFMNAVNHLVRSTISISGHLEPDSLRLQ